MDKALSTLDILNIVGEPFYVLQANFIEKIKDINKVFINNKCLIIYHNIDEFGNNKIGHWCCMKKINDNRIDFLDPYGDFIDSQQAIIKPQNGKFFSIRKMLYKWVFQNKNNVVHYNDKQIQEFKKNVNTCGRYCALFMKYDVNVEDFIDVLSHYKNAGYNIDQLVTLLT